MDRAQKQQLTASLHQDLAETVCVVVTHQTGLSVAEVTQLRRQMLSAGARYRVTKNRLAKRALEGTPFEGLAPLFTGPTAIAFSRDPVAAAKAAVEYANRNNKLTIVGGGLSGQVLDEAGGQGAGDAALARRVARQDHRPAQRAGDQARGAAADPGRPVGARAGGLFRAERRGAAERAEADPTAEAAEPAEAAARSRKPRGRMLPGSLPNSRRLFGNRSSERNRE